MPIVTVTVLPADEGTVDRVLAAVVAGVADGAGCEPHDVWASDLPTAAQRIGERAATAVWQGL